MANQDIKFEIQGLKEANKLLSQLPKELSDRVLYDINKAAGNIVKKQLQEGAPEGVNDKSSKNKIASNVLVKKSSTKTGVLIGFAKRVWYVKLIELGTKVRKLTGKGKYRKGTNRGSIKRKPFISEAHRRAYPRVIDFFVKNYLNIVNRSLKRMVKRFK